MFRGKDRNGPRVAGVLTTVGSREFESARKLAQMLFREVTGLDVKASDADTIEFLSRGEADSKAYWKVSVHA